jgi:hypothetical protein
MVKNAFRELTGIKVDDPWPIWVGHDVIDDPENAGKKLWVPNFEKGVADATNDKLLRQVANLALQRMKVSR